MYDFISQIFHRHLLPNSKKNLSAPNANLF